MTAPTRDADDATRALEADDAEGARVGQRKGRLTHIPARYFYPAMEWSVWTADAAGERRLPPTC